MPESAKPLQVPCPTCKQSALWSPTNEYRPFCSERCKLVDLGAWADEEHSIPGEMTEQLPEAFTFE